MQAEQAIYFGETPVNSKACPIMNKLAAGSCEQYHANAPLAYFKQIYFWKTPIAHVRLDVAAELHGLHEVAAGLDPAQGLSPDGIGVRREVGGALWRRPWLKAISLLTPPVGAFVVVYIAALAALFVTAFWTTNSFTGELIHHWTTTNFSQLWNASAYRTIAFRTIGIAAAVTLTDALIAIPFAYFMARLASRGRGRSSSCSSCSRCGRATWRASTRGS